MNLWSEGLGMFKGSPIWGTGFGSYWDFAGQTAHNSFLLCAAELGLLGYFFWMGLLVVSIWQLREVITAAGPETPEPELQRWARAVRLALYAFLLTSFFLSRTYAPLLYLLLGMAAAAANIEAERRGQQRLRFRGNWALWSLGLCVGSIALIYVMVRLRAI